MKTISQILSFFLGTILITSGIAMLTEGKAGNSKISNPTPGITYEIIMPAVLNTGDIMTAQPVSNSITSPMLEDPKYWVNYLNSTIDNEDENTGNTDSVVEEMQNNPTFWIDNLDKTPLE